MYYIIDDNGFFAPFTDLNDALNLRQDLLSIENKEIDFLIKDERGKVVDCNIPYLEF
jgi:hypothetical protein